MTNRMNNHLAYPESINLAELRPQIFVIDMINGFCKKGALADSEIMNIVDPIIDLLDHCDPNDVTFIADTHQEGDLEFKAFPPHCLKGSEEAEIIDELKAYVKTPILEKSTTNAFHELIKPNHQNLLERKESDSYILVGCCTDICVLQFALSLRTWLNAVEQDKRILIPRNCIETYHSPVHDAAHKNEEACALMKEAGIEIIDRIETRRNDHE